MKKQLPPLKDKEYNALNPALAESAFFEGRGQSQPPAPFQLTADPASSAPVGKDASTTPLSQAAPAQAYPDSTEIVGNVSAGRNIENELDDQSNQRIFERIAELRYRQPSAARRAVEAYVAMNESERPAALREAITWFQTSELGQRLIDQIIVDNNERSRGQYFYDSPAGTPRNDAAYRARYHAGEVHNNDVTMQALANSWPRTFLGRMVSEEEAYDIIHRLVLARGLPFNEATVNVISMRAFQGGEIHDNNYDTTEGQFYRANVYNDTTYILSKQNNVKRVTESRSTVDPGDLRSGGGSVFRMEADQQWDYSGNSRGDSTKYDRPMYGLADRTQVSRGRYWRKNPEILRQALEDGHNGARVISNRDGRRFADVNAAGGVNRVSAIHSGGSGSGTGDRVGGDSTGCTVVHGAWFPHFNESLRRAAGSSTDAIRFTYSLLDLRLFDGGELARIIETETT